MTRHRKAAIITGASSGIGRALAIELAARGFPVGLIARRGDELDKVAREIADAGGSTFASVADVGDRNALRAAIDEIEQKLGPTDVMVANAGYGVATKLDPLNTSEVEATFQINLMGVVYSIEAVLPGMLARGGGHIVAISSLGAFKGLPGESAYCASKAAVNAYTEGLRIALRRKNVVVATICPGFVRTSMLTMGSITPFLISAEDAAGRIARVIENRRGGVIKFPWPMAVLMAIFARLPDGFIARFFPEGDDHATAAPSVGGSHGNG